jgi:preprotein translocase subunit SecF
VNQVLNRTVTPVATVLLALLSVLILGGNSIRDLVIALIVGVSFGTYSSIFIASPIFLWLMGGGGTVQSRGTASARVREAS